MLRLRTQPPPPERPAPIVVDDPSRPIDRDVLRAEGGFLWWYADLRGADGEGLVLIWSFGLPFLPGYASAERRGRPQRPVDRPSLNVAVYAGGRERFYLLQEHDPADVFWDGHGTWRFGANRIESHVRHGRRMVRAALDCPLPGSDDRLRGVVSLEGAAARAAAPAVDDASLSPSRAPHRWTPLVGAARGTADLRAGGRVVARFEGPAYHDRNASHRPLHGLGIAHWVWGRFSLAGEELLYYVNFGEGGAAPVALVYQLGHDGRLTARDDLAPRFGRRRVARYGMPYWPGLALVDGAGRAVARIHRGAAVDDGPFYLRFLTRIEAPGGASGVGTEELCRPDRVDLDALRPFVRMRVHDLGAANTPLLPLLTGVRRPVPMKALALAARSALRLGGAAATRRGATGGSG